MTLPKYAGPLTPRHRAGHCQWNPKLEGKGMCGAVAYMHFWVDVPGGVDGVDAFTSYACASHWYQAQDLTHPIDWHECATTCIEDGTMWQWSTAERQGFCYHENETAEEAAEVLELVTAGQAPMDAQTGDDRG